MEPPETAVSPDAFPESDFYLSAFNTLSSERQIGALGGAGYIPWSSVLAYAAREGIVSHDEQDRFVRMMRAIDDEYLSYLAEKQKADTKS